MREKRAIIFDLDGTLTESKTPLDEEMAGLLCRLLEAYTVAVIGGGSYTQFQKQFLSFLSCDPSGYERLLILPLSGSSMYRYRDGAWREEYAESFTVEEAKRVMDAFDGALRDAGYVPPSRVYGALLENRGSQVTFSAVGQEAPLEAKRAWNEAGDIRPQIIRALRTRLPECEVRAGGFTSIDVTKQGIDKAYGIAEVSRATGIPEGSIVYVGDALYPGGNDEAALRTGVETVAVAGPGETKRFISTLLPPLSSRAS